MLANNKTNHVLLYLILVSPVLPYLLPSLRGDTVITFVVFSLLALFGWFSKEFKIERNFLVLAGVLALSSVLVLTSRVLHNVDSISANIVIFLRLFIPSLLILSLAYLLPDNEIKFAHLSRCMFFVGAFASIFTVFTIVADPSLFFGFYAPGGEDSVWWAAYQIRRYSGVFNQPLEAGVFYSSILILLVFNFKKRLVTRKEFAVFSFLIVLGGMLSLSKNFIVLGLGCAFLIYFFLSDLSRKVFIVGVFTSLAFVMVVFLYHYNQLYINSLIELYETEGFFYALSAGRFGSDTRLYILVQSFINEGFWLGVPTSTELPYDNAFIEYAYNGGIISFLLFSLFFVLSALIGLTIDNDFKVLLAVILLYGVLASMGGPVISANRANIYYLIVLMMPILSTFNFKSDNEQLNSAQR